MRTLALFTCPPSLQDKPAVAMLDTPGLRPRIDEDMDPSFLALLVAAGVIEPFAGLKTALNEDWKVLVNVLLGAWNRSADVTNAAKASATAGTGSSRASLVDPQYVSVLGCKRSDDAGDM